MPILNRYTNWRHTWTIIISGNFGGPGPFSDLLFYDPISGVGEFYSTDGQGNITLLRSYDDWDTDWDLIVPGNFGGTATTGQTDILLYSRNRGVASFLEVAGAADINTLNTYTDWDTDWDVIIPGNFGGASTTGQSDLLLYSRGRGAGTFLEVTGQGKIDTLNSYNDWGNDWDFIIPGKFGGNTGQSDIFFYSKSREVGGFYDVSGSGDRNMLRACDGGLIRCDLIVPGTFGSQSSSGLTDLCLWEREHGDLSFYCVKSKGLLSHIRSFDHFRHNTSIVVTGYFCADGRVTDLIFYDKGDGIGEFYVAYDIPNGTQIENAHVGTDAWKLVSPAPLHEIEGYASSTSVDRGNPITLCVSTIAKGFSLEIFRMGYYQGLGGRSMRRVENLAGIRQAVRFCDEDFAMPFCRWLPSYAFKIPDDWHSGVYLVKLTSDPFVDRDGNEIPSFDQYVTFVVRDDTSGSDILFQSSVNTQQAYNLWGGTSLYGDTSSSTSSTDLARRGYGVSFDRPYYGASGYGRGSGDLTYEYPMLKWLEQSGYDVTYCTDIDTNARGELILNHKAFLSIGHNEYWSLPMRNAVEVAIATGVSVAFLGANAVYWQVRIYSSGCEARADAVSAACISSAARANAGAAALGAASDNLRRFWTASSGEIYCGGRMIVCYKDSSVDPLNGVENARVTVNWRNDPVARPEDALIGQMFEGWFENGNFAWQAVNTTLWPFQGIGINDGDTFPGIVGYEYDRVYDGTETLSPPHTAYPAPAGLVRLGQSPVLAHLPVTLLPGVSHTTLYQSQSGCFVFSAGTLSWSWGLDDENLEFMAPWNNHQYGDPRLQALTTNLLNRFIGK
jgi:hypothetical protein